MGSLRDRIGRLRRAVRATELSGPLVVLIDRSGHRPPGLHRVGRPGSPAAVWSVGPGDVGGDPPGRVPPFARIIGGEIDPDAI